jgi:hypothetical protein
MLSDAIARAIWISKVKCSKFDKDLNPCQLLLLGGIVNTTRPGRKFTVYFLHMFNATGEISDAAVPF